MIRRIRTLSGYLFRSQAISISGIIMLLGTLAFWRLFFDPTQRTPEPSYYVLLTTLFGAGVTFLATIVLASRANQAISYPMLARLPSRVEHLTAVFFSAVLYATLLQLLLALLATWRGPGLSIGQVIEIPPLWISVNILAAVLALHASDLVARDWSRVYVYGAIALLLLLNTLSNTGFTWLISAANNMSTFFYSSGLELLGNAFSRVATWLSTGGTGALSNLATIIFWPFRALSEAVVAGYFTPMQALAPAVLLLYATALYMLAAEFFATKDLFLTE
jgi:hypothetical protein